jgi:O-antigen/teichoic acid export membrane protein
MIAPATSRLIAIAGSVVGTQVVNALLGMVFWTIAARLLAPSLVGQLGSVTAATMLLGTFGILGCGTLLISLLPVVKASQAKHLLISALVVSFCGTALLATCFGLIASSLMPSFAFLRPTGSAFWWLLAAAGLTSVGGVFDQAALVLGPPSTQVVRNGIAGLLKVVLLIGASTFGMRDVVGGIQAWALGQLAADLLALRAARRCLPGTDRLTVAGLRAAVAAYWREALRHHGLNIALAAPTMLMPVVVAAVVSEYANAIFTTIRLVTMFTFMAPYALAVALFAALATDTTRADQRARSTFRLSLFLSIMLTGTVYVAAPLLLKLFGQLYVEAGVHYLRLLAIAGPLLVFKDQYIACAQARRELGRITPFVLSAMFLEVVFTIGGALVGGLGGALWGWLLALASGAFWTCLPGRADLSAHGSNHSIQRRRQ